MINVVLCGDESVGKTSLLARLEDERFHASYSPTVAIDFKQIHTRNAYFRVVDTSGARRFEQVVTTNAKNTQIVVFVYDLNIPDSLHSIEKRWTNLVSWGVETKETRVGYLVGTKMDLPNGITDDEIDIIANRFNLIVAKTSAKTGFGVYDLFNAMGETTKSDMMVLNPLDVEYDASSSSSGEGEDVVKTSGCCCRRKFTKI
jgi:small GTP-binding protein